MFKRLTGIIAIVLSFLFLTGCGASVKQSGNKIYTDIPAETAYNFAKAALVAKGYEIKEMSKDTLSIMANSTTEENLMIEAKVSTLPDESTEIAVVAYINNVADQEKSERIAAQAVEELIKELDKYGKHQAKAAKEFAFPHATSGKLKDFVIASIQNVPNYMISETTEDKIIVKGKEILNPFNEPLQAEISITDINGVVKVNVNAVINGNYDVYGNQDIVDRWLELSLQMLNAYPLATKSIKYEYSFISSEKAANYANQSLQALGIYSHNDAGKLSAVKDPFYLDTYLTEVAESIVVNTEGFTEGDKDSQKTELEGTLTAELNKLRQQLAMYQTTVTSEKLFASLSNNEVSGICKKILVGLGYSGVKMTDNLIKAQKGENIMAVIKVNDLGRNGISLEVHSLYNGKNVNSLNIVKAENRKILDALAMYDKTELK